jgi:hypothetical protein
VRRLRLVLAVAVAVALNTPREAFACACCTNAGQRNVNVEAFDPGKRALLEELRFADAAKLFLGEADPDSIKGIANPSTAYALTATWQGDRLVFTLKDEQGHAGTLALELPNKISIFEVDPRDAPDQGTGPPLYKEWKLTGKAKGTGAFSPGGGHGQLLTLIVQGGGNSCTSASDFNAWTLVMQGAKANYSLFGDLKRAP